MDNSAMDTQQSTAGTPDISLLSSPSRQPVELKVKNDVSTILDKVSNSAIKGISPGTVADTQPEEETEEGSKSLAGRLDEDPAAATAESPAEEVAHVQSEEEKVEGGQSLVGVDEEPTAATAGSPAEEVAHVQSEEKEGEGSQSLVGVVDNEPTAATVGSPVEEVADVQSEEKEGEGGQSLVGVVDKEPTAATEEIAPVPATGPQAMVKKGKSAKVGEKPENEHRSSVPVPTRILRSRS
jgi:hypothetical protein